MGVAAQLCFRDYSVALPHLVLSDNLLGYAQRRGLTQGVSPLLCVSGSAISSAPKLGFGENGCVLSLGLTSPVKIKATSQRVPTTGPFPYQGRPQLLSAVDVQPLKHYTTQVSFPTAAAEDPDQI